MTVAFISDLHLTPERPDIQQRFEAFLSVEADRLDTLYILGDLFEYWIGDDASRHLGQEYVEQLLQRLCNQGVAVRVMRGNRDFLLGDDFARRTGCTLIPDPYRIRLGLRDVLLMHGDSLCTDDVEHQQFRTLVQSPDWQRAFLSESIGARDEVARRLRYRSEQGKRYKPSDIMDVNEHTVREVFAAHSAPILIHGHTHRPGVHTLTTGHRTVHRIVLGDWFEQQSVVRLSAAGLTLSPGGQTVPLD